MFAGIAEKAFRHVLLTEYLSGAAIGWHKDAFPFDRIVGISLGNECVMKLRRISKPAEKCSVTLEPRSAYLLSGEVRTAREHHIPPVRALRYSITFRSLRNG